MAAGSWLSEVQSHTSYSIRADRWKTEIYVSSVDRDPLLYIPVLATRRPRRGMTGERCLLALGLRYYCFLVYPATADVGKANPRSRRSILTIRSCLTAPQFHTSAEKDAQSRLRPQPLHASWHSVRRIYFGSHDGSLAALKVVLRGGVAVLPLVFSRSKLCHYFTNLK